MSKFDDQESELFRLLGPSSGDDRPSEQHREALREQALQTFNQALERKQQVLTQLNESPFSKWRELMRRPLPRMIAAAIVCLTIVAPWLFFPAHQTTAIALEKLASAIVDAKTAKFQSELKIEVPQKGGEKKPMPPVIFQNYYRAPGLMRSESTSFGRNTIMIHDEDTGRSIELNPDKKTGFIGIRKGKPANSTSTNPFTQIKEQLAKSRDKNDKENRFQELGEKEIDGRRAVGFKARSGAGEYTIWGDPITQLPLRIEILSYGNPQSTIVMSNFEVNVPLDDSLFTMTPPAGYQIHTQEFDASEPTEKEFLDGLKKCTELSGGEYPPGFAIFEISKFIEKHSKERLKKLGLETKDRVSTPEAVKAMEGEVNPILRSCRFVLGLPESADATYAGKGVKQVAKNKPIFWYKPKDSTKYRVVYADLAVKEAESAPVDPDAVRLIPKSEAPK